MSDANTTQIPASERSPWSGAEPLIEAFVIAWSAAEPHRTGEVAVIATPGTSVVLGRGLGEGSTAMEPRMRFFRQRPAKLEEQPPIMSPGISRRQLVIHAKVGGATIERVGQCPLEVNGERVDRADVKPGDVIVLRKELVLYCTSRAPLIAPMRLFPMASHAGPFGDADTLGIIGESPPTWKLREQLAFAAKAGTHVLLLGESGTGKELAARGIHLLSPRAGFGFVARNAATLPSGLMDAELFGNAKNYPNPGMAERAGLIGEADRGTLFLDEIGELPSELQAHLLRVLDADGEYQRLGDATQRRSDLRLVAATNRDPSSLKHDFLARFTARVAIAPLHERREDVPLLARYLVMRAAQRSPEIAGRFIATDATGRPYARLRPELVRHLLQREYTTNIRELDAVLFKAMSESYGDTLELPAEARGPSGSVDAYTSQVQSRPPPSRASTRPPPSNDPGPSTPRPERPEPTADEIRAALAASAGSVPKASEALGLSSRYVLYRLMKKHGIG